MTAERSAEAKTMNHRKAILDWIRETRNPASPAEVDALVKLLDAASSVHAEICAAAVAAADRKAREECAEIAARDIHDAEAAIRATIKD